MQPGEGRAWPRRRALPLARPFGAAGGRGARCHGDDGRGRRPNNGNGRPAIFRDDTFGDEQLWTDVLRMHEVVATLSPATALKVGLKVDVEALPQNVIDDLRAERVNLDDPAVTMLLLRRTPSWA